MLDFLNSIFLPMVVASVRLLLSMLMLATKVVVFSGLLQSFATHFDFWSGGLADCRSAFVRRRLLGDGGGYDTPLTLQMSNRIKYNICVITNKILAHEFISLKLKPVKRVIDQNQLPISWAKRLRYS